MYGNYCFWAWFRYWYLDSANYVTMILLDKGYFDYDFEKVDKPTPFVNWEDTIKSDEEVQGILKMFGVGSGAKKSLEDIQSHIIKQMKEDK